MKNNRRHFVAALQNCIQDKEVVGWEYTATAPLSFPVPQHLAVGLRPYMVESGWLAITPPTDNLPWMLDISQLYSTDGCTGAPDFFRGWTLERCLRQISIGNIDRALRYAAAFVAHWTHDAIFQFVRELARVFGWSIWRTIRFANDLFDWTMVECNGMRPDRDVYATAVRLVGHQFGFVTRNLRGE